MDLTGDEEREKLLDKMMERAKPTGAKIDNGSRIDVDNGPVHDVGDESAGDLKSDDVDDVRVEIGRAHV